MLRNGIIMKYQERTECQNWATKFDDSYSLSNSQFGILIKLRGVIMVLFKKGTRNFVIKEVLERILTS